MADKDYEEVSVNQLHTRLFGAPSQAVDQSPVVQQPAPLPVAPVISKGTQSNVAKPPPVNQPIAKEPDAEAVGKAAATAANTARENVKPTEPPSAINALVGELTNNWQVPAAILGTAAAAILGNKMFGGESAEKQKPKGIKERTFTKVEPTFEGNAVPNVETKPQPSSYPEGVTAETPVGNAPKDMELVRRSEYNKSENEINKAKAEAEKLKSQGAVVPEKQTKSKAIPTFKSPAEIPEGMVFRPDVGNLDRSLVNILGPEGRLYAKEVLNEGKMFGEYKGADYNKKVKELVGAYGEKLKEITPSIDLTTREGRVAAGAPHTQNYGSALGKAAKVGGVLGTLMTVAQSANAREAAGNVAESLLPIGATPTSLNTGEEAELARRRSQFQKESQKLGSPFRSVPPPR